MNKHHSEEKQIRRFLKSIARRASAELAQLRAIPQTPPACDYFYDVLESVYVRNEPERALPARWDNRPRIGVYCIMVPEELIYAAGAVPVRLCAGCHESTLIGEDHVPRDGCPVVKSSMGFSTLRGLKAFDHCDVVVIPTTCDAKRKFGEELSAFKEVWMLETPHIKDAEFSRRMWMEQMYAFKARLQTYTRNGGGKNKITSRRLAKAVGNSAAAQSEMRRLLALRKSGPAIWGRQTAAVVNAYAYAPVTHWTRALAELNRQLSENLKQGRRVCSEARPRIYIAGSPLIFPNLKLVNLVEEMGGIVAADESCAGDRYLYDPVGSTEKTLRDQMTAIASRYMAPCVCPSFAPNDDRLVLIKRMVADYGVQGVLYHVLKGCVIYDFEVYRVEKALKAIHVPLLRIETDYNPEDVEQIRTRIEAFIEMLKSRREPSLKERL